MELVLVRGEAAGVYSEVHVSNGLGPGFCNEQLQGALLLVGEAEGALEELAGALGGAVLLLGLEVALEDGEVVVFVALRVHFLPLHAPNRVLEHAQLRPLHARHLPRALGPESAVLALPTWNTVCFPLRAAHSRCVPSNHPTTCSYPAGHPTPASRLPPSPVLSPGGSTGGSSGSTGGSSGSTGGSSGSSSGGSVWLRLMLITSTIGLSSHCSTRLLSASLSRFYGSKFDTSTVAIIESRIYGIIIKQIRPFISNY